MLKTYIQEDILIYCTVKVSNLFTILIELTENKEKMWKSNLKMFLTIKTFALIKVLSLESEILLPKSVFQIGELILSCNISFWEISR